mmetsp:Transcript_24238/g.41404  ORF Transcript_24238/g.41404 Transcript_24238/m.41404 type:complete len:222 (-) Transcript_24238:221-886(-)
MSWRRDAFAPHRRYHPRTVCLGRGGKRRRGQLPLGRHPLHGGRLRIGRSPPRPRPAPSQEPKAQPDGVALLPVAAYSWLAAARPLDRAAHRAARGLLLHRLRAPLPLLRLWSGGLPGQHRRLPPRQTHVGHDAQDDDDGEEWRAHPVLGNRNGRDHHTARGGRLHRPSLLLHPLHARQGNRETERGSQQHAERRDRRRTRVACWWGCGVGWASPEGRMLPG